MSNKLSVIEHVFLRIARHQPFNRGPIRRRLVTFFKKRIDHPIESTYRGVPFLFNLDNPTEQRALFGFYNNKEVDYVVSVAGSKSPVFVDIGANSGFYTQIFLFHATAGGMALSIEPNPEMCKRITANASLIADRVQKNKLRQFVENCAVGDQEGELYLSLKLGVGAANIVDTPERGDIKVRVEKLLSLLQTRNINRVDILKIDVEGYEDRVLLPFFSEANPALFPKSILIEHTSDQAWHGDLWGELSRIGYREVFRTRGNVVLHLTAQ